MKIIRTDLELETPHVDATLRAAGHTLVLLPDGIPEDTLITHVRDADLLLMCYTPITARVIAAAPRLKGIVKYGVGIDAIDIPAARARGIAVVNILARIRYRRQDRRFGGPRQDRPLHGAHGRRRLPGAGAGLRPPYLR
jgi:phosphoglycerate dehydrogenase-like enzyme